MRASLAEKGTHRSLVVDELGGRVFLVRGECRASRVGDEAGHAGLVGECAARR